MSNVPPIPKRFRLIDETNWNDYHYIGPGDECLYIWERMSKVKVGEWDQYPANRLISNLQIPISCKTENPFRYKHKISAVKHAAQALGKLMGDFRDVGTCVPVPPSKVRDDPEHDPRLLKVLRAVRPPLTDIRELILLKENCDAKQKGRTPEERSRDYRVNEEEAEPEPTTIVIVDDVLTTGCHFKAVKTVLERRFQGASIYGIFLTRAVRPPEDFEF